MREPHRSEFVRLLRAGAAERDIHDAEVVDDGRNHVSDAFVANELARVASHRRSLVPLLERAVGRAPRILDFGCGTGGTTVAMAESRLDADEIHGVDANPRVIETARIRADGHALVAPRVAFAALAAGAPLPFPDGHFALVISVSVLEFVRTEAARVALVGELRRVVAPGGHLYLATPRPQLRSHHSGRWLGDLRRPSGEPWASPPWRAAAWGAGWERVALAEHVAVRARERVPWLSPRASRAVASLSLVAGRWQKLLFRRPR